MIFQLATQKKESLDILYPGAASSIKKTLNDLQLNDSINNALKRIGIEELDLNKDSIKNLDLTQLNEAMAAPIKRNLKMKQVLMQLKLKKYIIILWVAAPINRKKLEFKNEIDQLIKNDPFSTKK